MSSFFCLSFLLLSGCGQLDLSIRALNQGSSSLFIETQANGAGVATDAHNIQVGATINLFSILRNQDQSFRENIAASWSLQGNGGSLTIGPDNRYIEFTALAVGSSVLRASYNGQVYEAQLTTYNGSFVATLSDSVLYLKQGVPFSHVLEVSGGSSPYTYAISGLADTGVVNNGGKPEITSNAVSLGSHPHVLSVTDSQGRLSEVPVTLEINAYAMCVWTGATDTLWTDPSNWKFCYSNTPQTADRFSVPTEPSNQPVLTANATVDAVGPASGGGSVTVAPGAKLTLNNTAETITSSIKFQGQAPSCTTCRIETDTTRVLNGAAIELGTGLIWEVTYNDRLYLGDGTTAGHLIVNHGSSTPSEWPQYGDSSTNHAIIANGTDSEKSRLQIDGMRIVKRNFTQEYFHGVAHYQIDQFDNIEMSRDRDGSDKNGLVFQNCETAIFNDTDWQNINMITPNDRRDNIDLSSCSPSGALSITVSGSGAGTGEAFVNDPNNLLVWTNSATFTCAWTGAVDTSWANSANWSGCNNGRGGVPDHNDEVFIPSAPVNQPVISDKRYILRFAPGAGGGTITIMPTARLYLTTPFSDHYQSSVTVAANASCADCELVHGTTSYIINDATLSLGPDLTVQSNRSMLVGTATSAGHLEVLRGGVADPNRWTVFRADRYTTTSVFQGIRMDGPSGSPSTLRFDGLVALMRATTEFLRFEGAYEILGMDNVTVSHVSASNNPVTPSTTTFEFRDCTLGVNSDPTWDGIEITETLNAGVYNFDLSDASCSTMNPISLTNYSGGGMTSTAENDPFNLISW